VHRHSKHFAVKEGRSNMTDGLARVKLGKTTRSTRYLVKSKVLMNSKVTDPNHLRSLRTLKRNCWERYLERYMKACLLSK
jgi:hypothetical protein